MDYEYFLIDGNIYALTGYSFTGKTAFLEQVLKSGEKPEGDFLENKERRKFIVNSVLGMVEELEKGIIHRA